MEDSQNNHDQSPPEAPAEVKTTKPEVIVIRNWKEYLGESLLIIFSVGLALLLTELINKANDKRQIKELINNVRVELVHNKKEEEKQYKYHLGVLHNLDSALTYPAFASQIIGDYEFHLERMAPHG